MLGMLPPQPRGSLIAATRPRSIAPVQLPSAHRLHTLWCAVPSSHAGTVLPTAWKQPYLHKVCNHTAVSEMYPAPIS